MAAKSFVVGFALIAGLLAGCSKKAESEAEAPAEAAPAATATAPAKPGVEILPGASSVRQAMAQKDYSRAVTTLMSLTPAIVTEEQRIEYGSLLGEVRTTLEENAKTDPKASQALMQMHAMRSGR